jgi:hypothetical protein
MEASRSVSGVEREGCEVWELEWWEKEALRFVAAGEKEARGRKL